MMGSQHV